MQIGSLNANASFNRLYQVSDGAINWIAKVGGAAGGAFLGAVKKVAGWAVSFFANTFSFVKNNIGAGFSIVKNSIQSNPKLYVIAGVGLGVGLAVGALFNRHFGKAAPAAAV